ncbi:hypothetical protein [Mesorhizobium sp. L48C026A00]|uniref:hypothetical protein n=1 Tax=Mesorhizobium sp. L48C026A00 TaxID=1287182 RepID=UPI0003CFB5A2|nr:hypothetical protein [Mesorhizobium sp. L48C026A00]ESZ19948.1 hypothetical protein X737_13350 [Mesorhizobium sp. L48C026A00]
MVLSVWQRQREGQGAALSRQVINLKVNDVVHSQRQGDDDLGYTMGDLLQFLGDMLGNLISGNRSKSKFMRWLERAVIAIVVGLIPLVLYRMYS